MIDVNALGSEKLRDRARRIVHIVTDLDYEEADKLLKSARWNVKIAIVMQKTGLTYPKADGAAPQIRRSDPRSHRRGHRAAAARLDQQLEPLRGAGVQHHRHSRVHLQYRRR